MKKIFLLLFSIFIFSNGQAFDKLSFDYKINGVSVNFKIFSWDAMPGDTINLTFSGFSSDQFVGKFSQGELIENDRLNWQYVLPVKPGHYELTILHNNPPEKALLNIFVKVTALKPGGDYLNGYRIGQYPQKLFRNNPKYKPPVGFIEVTKANMDTRVSPHFQLKQFLCKQQPGQWPKYLLLDPLLLIKLELVLERLQQKGIPAKTLFIMSGYRTPFYNASINNGKYSRHIYGDAADIYVDEDKNSIIDDLNRDGKASMADADVIYQIVESIEKEPQYYYLIGGMGKYKKTSSHTWDVHVDARGYRARW